MKHLLLAVCVTLACSQGNPVESVSTPSEYAESKQAWSPTDAPTDTIMVDLAGTRLRLVNSSGGSLIASNKPLILLPDWNVRAWPQDHPEGGVDVESRDWNLYVTTNWKMDLHCRERGGDVSVHRHVLNEMDFSGNPFITGADPSTDRSNPCRGEITALSFHDRGSWWHNADGTSFKAGGTMKFLNNTIALHGTTAFRAPYLSITYHPVSDEPSQAARDAAYLQGVVRARWGYKEEINRMLPVLFEGLRHVGDPLIVPYDPEAESMLERVLLALDETIPAEPLAVKDGVIHLHVAVVNERVERVYLEDYTKQDTAGGIAFQDKNLSAVYHEPDFFEEGPRALIHEIGHNLGLIHTHENPDYPRHPDIDLDGYRVNRNGEVHLIDRDVYVDFMSYFDPPWVSNYSWNGIVDFMYPPPAQVSARATGRIIRTWRHHDEH